MTPRVEATTLVALITKMLADSVLRIHNHTNPPKAENAILSMASGLICRKSPERLKWTRSVYVAHIYRRLNQMNGENKKQLALALASFAVLAVIAGVLGNSKARGKLVEGGKNFIANFRKGE